MKRFWWTASSLYWLGHLDKWIGFSHISQWLPSWSLDVSTTFKYFWTTIFLSSTACGMWVVWFRWSRSGLSEKLAHLVAFQVHFEFSKSKLFNKVPHNFWETLRDNFWHKNNVLTFVEKFYYGEWKLFKKNVWHMQSFISMAIVWTNLSLTCRRRPHKTHVAALRLHWHTEFNDRTSSSMQSEMYEIACQKPLTEKKLGVSGT